VRDNQSTGHPGDHSVRRGTASPSSSVTTAPHGRVALSLRRRLMGELPAPISPPRAHRLLRSALALRLPPCLPSRATTTVPRRRASQGSTPLYSPLDLAPPSSPHLRHEHFFGRHFLPDELTITSRCLCTSGPTTTSRRTARPRSSPTSTPSSPATSCLSCRHRPLRR
jgi:hypothetical protein